MSGCNDTQALSSTPDKSALKTHSSRNRAGESKADSRYWLQGSRLRFNNSPEYSIQVQAQGKRVWFSTGTPNKKAAAAKAAEIYSYVRSQGLDAAIARYKPKASIPERPVTVGELISTACSISTARSHSLDAYSKAFRRIVAEIKSIDDQEKHDAHKGGNSSWRKRVDAVPLSSLTPADIVAWKNRRLKSTELNPVAKRAAIVTVNSLIRNAKALFGKKVLPFVEQQLTIPRPLPFEGVPMEKPPSLRYISRVDAHAVISKAKSELAPHDPEAFKVILLALVLGLRRSEIDNLLWRSFDFQGHKLRIEPTEYHQLKSEDSAGELDLDEDLLSLFRGYFAHAFSTAPDAPFVIASPRKAKTRKAGCYRCDPVFERAMKWLRAQPGVDQAKPLHTMRKEIGSIIASEEGIYAASRYLRHSNVGITAAFYADKKKAITPRAFAGLLAPTPLIAINLSPTARPEDTPQTIQQRVSQ